jgi:hypothetical protein
MLKIPYSMNRKLIYFLIVTVNISISYIIHNPPPFNEVLVPSQESERSCICVFEVLILPLSTILIFNSGIVQTVWCAFCFPFYEIIILWRKVDISCKG